MRPQIALCGIYTAFLLIATTAFADPFPSHLEHKMQRISLKQLSSYVQQLSYGDLLYVNDLRTQGFPQEQLSCQRAITHGSISYVRRWIDATESGMTPEDANRFATTQLEGVVSVCNVPVVENASGIRMPSVGGPCSTATSNEFVDPFDLQECLQKTLEFWASYLYIPVNQ